MKPSSFLTVAVATVLVTLCTSFSSGKGASRSSVSGKFLPTSHQSSESFTPSLRWDNHYYWYLSNGDVYDGWFTISDEITRLENMYGVYVDLSPTGGATLLSKGYILYGTPHLIWASYSCYGHF